MSIAVQKTLTVTIDEKVYDVADLSQEAQQMIVYLDDWRQQEADETSCLLKTRAAIHDIQNNLLAQIQRDESQQQSDADGETVEEVEVSVE